MLSTPPVTQNLLSSHPQNMSNRQRQNLLGRSMHSTTEIMARSQEPGFPILNHLRGVLFQRNCRSDLKLQHLQLIFG